MVQLWRRTHRKPWHEAPQLTLHRLRLAATADCMFSIWQEEEDAELGIIKLGKMKNRFGQNFGSCTLQIDYPTLTLTQDENQPENIELPEGEMCTLDFLSSNE